MVSVPTAALEEIIKLPYAGSGVRIPSRELQTYLTRTVDKYISELGAFGSNQIIPNVAIQMNDKARFIGLLNDTQNFLANDAIPWILGEECMPVVKTNIEAFHFRNLVFGKETLTNRPIRGTRRHISVGEEFLTSGTVNKAVSFDIVDSYAQLPFALPMVQKMLLLIDRLIKLHLTSCAFAKIMAPDPRMSVYVDKMDNLEKYLHYMCRERDNFCLANKKPNGLATLIQKSIQSVYRKSHIEPRDTIIPHDKRILVTAENKLTTIYSEGGQRAVDNINGDGSLGVLCGTTVHLAPQFSLDDDELDDPSVRLFRGGEIVLLDCDDTEKNLFHMYDIDCDAPSKIRFEDALKAQYWLTPVFTLGVFTGYVLDTAFANKVLTEESDLFKDLKNNPCDVAFKLSATGNTYEAETATPTPLTLEQVKDQYDIVIIRPANSYYTKAVVVLAGNRDFGVTTVSDNILTMGANQGNGTFNIAVDIRMGGHILNYDRSEVTYHAFYDGYVGGGNTKFMDLAAAKTFRDEDFDISDPTQPSMYSILVKKGSYKLGAFAPLVGNYKGLGFPADTHSSDGYPGARVAARLYGWDSLRFQTFPDGNYSCNLAMLLFPGTLLDNKKNYITHGRTHHGEYEGPGCSIVRHEGLGIIPQVDQLVQLSK